MDRKGELSPISVVVKARQGRKSNTLVTGFEPFFLEAEEMADELKRLCAASTSGMCSTTFACFVANEFVVSPVHGKASGLAVLVQGKQIKLVTQFLLSKGVPKEWIMSVGTKTEKKK
jgi:translation initiation factor 2D